MKKIVLIDGNSLMFRAYFATSFTGNLMKTSKGLYTNAIYGFCNMINKVIKDGYDYIFVAFDAGKQTFRHLAYDGYKEGRKKMDDEFRVQIPYIKKYLDILNITHYESLNYEADDLIASVSEMAKANNIDDILILSGDKDLLQLVSGNVHVSLTAKGISELDDYNEDNFFGKMGFYPYQIPDYKGLAGDKSDNLPGIEGIGDKGAKDLLLEYNSLENIISNIDNIKGKKKDVINEHKDMGLMCKKLATLKRDIALDFGLKDLEKRKENLDDLKEFYTELEFKSFLKRLDGATSDTSESEKKEVKEIKLDLEYRIIDDVNYDFTNLNNDVLVFESIEDNYNDITALGVFLYTDNLSLFSENIFVTKDVIILNILLIIKKHIVIFKERVLNFH